MPYLKKKKKEKKKKNFKKSKNKWAIYPVNAISQKTFRMDDKITMVQTEWFQILVPVKRPRTILYVFEKNFSPTDNAVPAIPTLFTM